MSWLHELLGLVVSPEMKFSYSFDHLGNNLKQPNLPTHFTTPNDLKI